MTGAALLGLLHLSAAMPGATTYDAAYQRMEETGRPLMVVVGSEWCPACHTLKNTVLSKLRQNGTLSKVEFAQIDRDNDAVAGQIMQGRMVPQVILFSRTARGWQKRHFVGLQAVTTIQSAIETASQEATASPTAVASTAAAPNAVASATTPEAETTAPTSTSGGAASTSPASGASPAVASAATPSVTAPSSKAPSVTPSAAPVVSTSPRVVTTNSSQPMPVPSTVSPVTTAPRIVSSTPASTVPTQGTVIRTAMPSVVTPSGTVVNRPVVYGSSVPVGPTVTPVR